MHRGVIMGTKWLYNNGKKSNSHCVPPRRSFVPQITRLCYTNLIGPNLRYVTAISAKWYTSYEILRD